MSRRFTGTEGLTRLPGPEQKPGARALTLNLGAAGALTEASLAQSGLSSGGGCPVCACASSPEAALRESMTVSQPEVPPALRLWRLMAYGGLL